MTFGEIVFYVSVTSIFLVIINKLLFQKSQKEYNEYDRSLKSRLREEKIYHPETGIRMTLEQAESGAWINNNSSARIRSAEEIENYFDGAEKIVERIANILKEGNYRPTKISAKQIKGLETSSILSKYDDWSYSNAFKINENNLVLFPKVNIHYRGKGTTSFNVFKLCSGSE